MKVCHFYINCLKTNGQESSKPDLISLISKAFEDLNTSKTCFCHLWWLTLKGECITSEIRNNSLPHTHKMWTWLLVRSTAPTRRIHVCISCVIASCPLHQPVIELPSVPCSSCEEICCLKLVKGTAAACSTAPRSSSYLTCFTLCHNTNSASSTNATLLDK